MTNPWGNPNIPLYDDVVAYTPADAAITYAPGGGGAQPCKGFIVNATVGGNVVVQTAAGGANVTLTFPIGWFLVPIRVSQIRATGLTLTGTFWGLF